MRSITLVSSVQSKKAVLGFPGWGHVPIAGTDAGVPTGRGNGNGSLPTTEQASPLCQHCLCIYLPHCIYYSFPSVLTYFSIFLAPSFSPPLFLVYVFAYSLALGVSILSLFVFGWWPLCLSFKPSFALSVPGCTFWNGRSLCRGCRLEELCLSANMCREAFWECEWMINRPLLFSLWLLSSV